MKSFEITLVDEPRNYEVIRFLNVLVKGLNVSDSPCVANDEITDDGKCYKFSAMNMTSGQVRALADILDTVYKRTELAIFLLR